MNSKVRTFRAPSMQAALDIVRQEMGQDAVILNTRHIEKRRLIPFLPARQEIEVTAGIDAPARGVKPPQPTIAAAKIAELAPPPELLSGPAIPSVADTVLRAEAGTSTLPNSSQRNSVVPPRWSPNDVIADVPARPRTGLKKSVAFPSLPSRQISVARQAAALEQTANHTPSETPGQRSTVSRMSEPRSGEFADSQDLHQRLDTLQRMILELGKERPRTTLSDIPSELFQIYTQLIANEVDEDLARELVCRAKERASRTQLHSPAAMQTLVTALAEQELRIGDPIRPSGGRRKVVALVGPTGVGKTTTVAKLAANLRLREGVKVGLITVDTYRIAAVEQLKTYAELIDLPMKVVTSPSEMEHALRELQGLDLVLIDTAGRSPRDDLKIQELKDCLDAARVDEVHLVLSVASGMSTLESVADKFKPVGVGSIILTKLDEATSAGMLLSVGRRLRTPVSYLTTGQNVPDDIEPAHATRMARLILGLERVL